MATMGTPLSLNRGKTSLSLSHPSDTVQSKKAQNAPAQDDFKAGEVSIVAVVAGVTVDRTNPSPVTIIMVVVVIPIVVAVIAVSVVTPMIVIGRRPSR
jgi:hypothetical protein